MLEEEEKDTYSHLSFLPNGNVSQNPSPNPPAPSAGDDDRNNQYALASSSVMTQLSALETCTPYGVPQDQQQQAVCITTTCTAENGVNMYDVAAPQKAEPARITVTTGTAETEKPCLPPRDYGADEEADETDDPMRRTLGVPTTTTGGPAAASKQPVVPARDYHGRSTTPRSMGPSPSDLVIDLIDRPGGASTTTTMPAPRTKATKLSRLEQSSMCVEAPPPPPLSLFVARAFSAWV